MGRAGAETQNSHSLTHTHTHTLTGGGQSKGTQDLQFLHSH